jgi:hypothetical protein
MAFEEHREQISRIVEEHHDAALVPSHSAPVARSIANHAKQLNVQVPLAIRRYMDRLDGPKGEYGLQEKLSRDIHGVDYGNLPADEQEAIRDHLHSMHNPAGNPDYFRSGMNFAQGHNLLIAAYGEENSVPKPLRPTMKDFVKALELDLQSAARHSGFDREYSEANLKLYAAVNPHRINQSTIMTSRVN